MTRTLKEIEADLKKQNFEIYYRAIKARTSLIGLLPAMIKINDDFFRDNPDYVEGAMCGKLKERK